MFNNCNCKENEDPRQRRQNQKIEKQYKKTESFPSEYENLHLAHTSVSSYRLPLLCSVFSCIEYYHFFTLKVLSS